MASRNYERLEIEPFGRQLITSGDLDPVYIALDRLREHGMDPRQIHRWLIAYWCFYHCGLASYASEHEGAAFWDALRMAAANETQAPPGGRWPRGHERRHARGAQGFNMVRALAERYGDSPEGMVNYICSGSWLTVEGQPLPFTKVAGAVREHTLFGPWIAFKVCDMVDRVLGIPVDFSEADVFMFKDPVNAALMFWRQKNALPESAKPRDQALVIRGVVAYLAEQLGDLRAPPLGDRPVGLQEIETVLCKWKSHMNGHYPLFNDIDEIREGLEGWGSMAQDFEAMLPAGSKS